MEFVQSASSTRDHRPYKQQVMLHSKERLLTLVMMVAGEKKERKKERKRENESSNKGPVANTLSSCHLSNELWICSRKTGGSAPLLPSPSSILPGGAFLLVFDFARRLLCYLLASNPLKKNFAYPILAT